MEVPSSTTTECLIAAIDLSLLPHCELPQLITVIIAVPVAVAVLAAVAAVSAAAAPI